MTRRSGITSATMSCQASSTMRCVRAASSGSGPPAARPARRPTRWRSRSPRSSTADRRSTSASSRPMSTPRRSRSPVAASIRRARSRACRRRCAAATSRRSGPGSRSSRGLRSQMVFGEHDLSTRVPFPRIDLLLCRNVLIYFTPPLQRVALETFAYSLRPDGRLILGPSETVAALPGPYDEEHARLRIYRRLPGQQPVPHCVAEGGSHGSRSRHPPRSRDPVDPARRGCGRRAGSTRRGDPARPRHRPDRGRCALRHHSHQHGGATGPGHPWHGVRPGLRPPRRRVAVDPDPQRHRVGPQGQGQHGRLPGRIGRRGGGRAARRPGDRPAVPDGGQRGSPARSSSWPTSRAASEIARLTPGRGNGSRRRRPSTSACSGPMTS